MLSPYLTTLANLYFEHLYFEPGFVWSRITASVPSLRLHDGGVIIDQGRIASAGCVFPVSQRDIQDRAIGLRHRAGMGITEETDAIALVVSEETGALSLCYQGKLEHDLEPDDLRQRINEILAGDANDVSASDKDKEDSHELGHTI